MVVVVAVWISRFDPLTSLELSSPPAFDPDPDINARPLIDFCCCAPVTLPDAILLPLAATTFPALALVAILKLLCGSWSEFGAMLVDFDLERTAPLAEVVFSLCDVSLTLVFEERERSGSLVLVIVDVCVRLPLRESPAHTRGCSDKWDVI